MTYAVVSMKTRRAKGGDIGSAKSSRANISISSYSISNGGGAAAAAAERKGASGTWKSGKLLRVGRREVY